MFAAVLRLAPDDLDALRAKLVLLIEVSRFDDALKLLDTAALAEQAPYEKACASVTAYREQAAQSAQPVSRGGGLCS